MADLIIPHFDTLKVQHKKDGHLDYYMAREDRHLRVGVDSIAKTLNLPKRMVKQLSKQVLVYSYNKKPSLFQDEVNSLIDLGFSGFITPVCYETCAGSLETDETLTIEDYQILRVFVATRLKNQDILKSLLNDLENNRFLWEFKNGFMFR